MYTKVGFVLLFLLFTCQTGKLELVNDLPKSLKEVSGMETSVDGESLYMINDSGNKPEIFVLDLKGKLKEILDVDAKNIDWEELTTDKEGHLYIGDFGNNMNDRDNLAIYKVHPEKKTKKGELEVEKIWFKFPDQKEFPPKRKHRFFDCESFIYLNNHFYLFTKSRAPKKHGLTTLYKVPATPGHHIAEKIDSFETCEALACWITAADISEDGKTIALLTADSVWLFENFEGDNFFSGNHKQILFEHESQKESLCFIDERTIYIADEQNKTQGRNLYKFRLN